SDEANKHITRTLNTRKRLVVDLNNAQAQLDIATTHQANNTVPKSLIIKCILNVPANSDAATAYEKLKDEFHKAEVKILIDHRTTQVEKAQTAIKQYMEHVKQN